MPLLRVHLLQVVGRDAQGLRLLEHALAHRVLPLLHHRLLLQLSQAAERLHAALRAEHVLATRLRRNILAPLLLA